MRRDTASCASLVALLPLLSLSHSASASFLRSDTTVTISPQPAARASAVSGPAPVDLGGGRVFIAPFGQGPGEQFGNSVASAGDVNGDGYPDVMVAAWASDVAAGDAGAVYVYFGGPGADDISDLTLLGQSYGDNFGTSVASAGDMNGDGYNDLIVGAWLGLAGSTGTGRAYVFFGGPAADTTPDLVLLGEAFDDRFGISVDSAGDVNADGFSDVIVGAPGNDAGGSGAGRAYVYFGGPSPDANPDLILTGQAAGGAFGYAVSPAGDLNSDGFADIVVGAYASGGMGRAFVFFGGPGLDAVPDRTFSGEAQGDKFGIDVASAGDLNGDGYLDLVVGADGNDMGGLNAGRAYVFYGGPSLDTTPDRIFTGASSGDGLGVSDASAGDMNGDGFADLVVGAWLGDAGGRIDAGRAYIFFGGPGGDTVPDVTLSGEGAGDRLGVSVAGVGDMDGDGLPNVIVGAYFNDFGGADAGRAYVVGVTPTRPPVVTAPAVVNGSAGVLITFSVTASDPDDDAIASLTAAPLPAGASFTPNGTHTSGTFSWVPGPLQTGDYVVTFTASNSLSGSATTQIQVINSNRPPVLDPLTDVTLNEGESTDQALHGSDPDGDPLTFGLASGPSFASVTTTNATSGNLHLAPGFSDAGSYTVTVRADDGRGGTATASLNVIVNGVNRPPVLTVPAGIFGAEGVSISVAITAVDPDGDHLRLGALNRPIGSLFVDFGNGSGNFSWTPGFYQAGEYTVTFTARDDLGASATPRDLTIVVDNVNRGPTAAPGGPYTGVVNVPITFNGTGSTDPDGSPLSYAWDFGDFTAGSGVTPLHTYATGGTFSVTLTVSDGSLTDAASTISTIQDTFPARAFTSQSNATIRLGSGKATWCAEIEPIGNSFLTTSVIQSTIAMRYGTGQIFAQAGKVSIGGDKDANGIQEITACFSKNDLRTLFAGLPRGTNTVTVNFEGNLTTGGRFQATLTVDVVSSGGALAASLSPNPLNPEGTITFRTSRPGNVKVLIFDLHGRLVRSLEPGTDLGVGYHDVRLDGRSDQGEQLPSGVYFYRIEAAEGVDTGQFVIAR
jgi:PKD repeat protein